MRGPDAAPELRPAAAWAWTVGCAAAAFRTDNPLLLVLLVAVMGAVVATWASPEGPWRRAFPLMIALGAVFALVRLLLVVLFAPRVPGHVLFTLPSVPVPDWMAGVTIGGRVTTEAVVGALVDSARILAVMAAFGAASSLVSPARLLAGCPGALYEVGVALAVGVAAAPLAAGELRRHIEMRRLRGRPVAGPRGWLAAAAPVLEGALDRSVDLAASLDSRGFGRSGPAPASGRSFVAAVGGLMATGGGLYLSGSRPGPWGPLLLVTGGVLLLAAAVVRGQSAARTRYRPAPWRRADTLAVAGGLLVVIGSLAQEGWFPGSLIGPAGVVPALELPLLAAVGTVFGLLPVLARTSGVKG